MEDWKGPEVERLDTESKTEGPESRKLADDSRGPSRWASFDRGVDPHIQSWAEGPTKGVAGGVRVDLGLRHLQSKTLWRSGRNRPWQPRREC